MAEPPSSEGQSLNISGGTNTGVTQVTGDGNVVMNTITTTTIVYQRGMKRGDPELAEVFSINPYPGMVAFKEGDARWFFGREETTRRVLTAFEAVTQAPMAPEGHRILPILGPSGSGKSSVARAGFVPELRKSPTGRSWRIATFRPTATPLESLAAALAELETDDAGQIDAKADAYEKRLREPLAGAVEKLKDGRLAGDDASAACRGASDVLVKILRRLGKDGDHVLLLVDQFEEVFSLCGQALEAQAFIQMLLDATADPDGPLSVALTMRSDFMGQTQAHNELNQILAKGCVMISAMSRSEVRDAILKPADSRGVSIDDAALVNALVEETVKGEGMLPLLQFMLQKIWQGMAREVEPAGTVRAEGGDLGGAVATSADRIYGTLSEPQRAIARQVFLDIVTFNADLQPTRNPALLGEMVRPGQDPEDIRKVLDRFTDQNARLIVLSGEEGDVRVDVAHEALFTRWPKLMGWLDENRDDIRLHRRIADAAKEWADQKRPTGSLWRPPNLELLSKYAERARLTQLETEFLQASQAAIDEEERRERLQRSNLLATAAFQELRDGDEITAVLLALEALPEDEADSPDYHRAEAALRAAVLNQTIVFGREDRPCATLSRDGSTLWLGGDNYRTVKVDALTGETVRIYPESMDDAEQLAVDAGGARLAAGFFGKVRPMVCPDSGDPVCLDDGGEAWAFRIVFSPYGDRVAVSYGDGFVRLWDSDSGELQLTIDCAPKGQILVLEWSPDGDQVLTGDTADSAARIWDSWNGDEIARLEHTGAVRQARYSPDGLNIVTVDTEEGSAFVWETLDYGQTRRLDGGGTTRGAEFSDDGNFLMTWSTDNKVRIWETLDFYDAEPAGEDDSDEGGSSDGGDDLKDDGEDAEELQARAGHDGPVSWDAEGRVSVDWSVPEDDGEEAEAYEPRITPVRTLEGHEGPVSCGAFAPDGRIATGSRDFTVRVWDAQGRCLNVLRGHVAALSLIGFTSDPDTLVTQSDDGSVRGWNLRKRAHAVTYAPPADVAEDGVIFAAAFSQDGSNVVGVYTDSTIATWDAATGELLDSGVKGERVLRNGNAAISHDGRFVALSAPWGAELVDTVTGDVSRLEAPQYFAHFAFSPDGKHLACTPSSGERSQLWNPLTKTLLRTLEADGAVTFFPSDDNRVFFASYHGGVIVDGAGARFLKRKSPQLRGAVSPDGQLLATIAGATHAYLWDAATGELLRILQGHKGTVEDVAFSSDGRLIATASLDCTVRLWDAQLAECLATFQAHDEPIRRLRFSPDDKAILSLAGQEAHLWPIDAGRGRELRDVAKVLAQCWTLGQHDRLRYGLPPAEDPKPAEPEPADTPAESAA